MGKLTKMNNNLPAIPSKKPDKQKHGQENTLLVLQKHSINQTGLLFRATRKINKDGSITDKIEHRHK